MDMVAADACSLQLCYATVSVDARSIQVCQEVIRADAMTLGANSNIISADARSLQMTMLPVSADSETLQHCGLQVVGQSGGGGGGGGGAARKVTCPSCSISGLTCKDWSLMQAVNLGWSWSCTVPGYLGDSIALGEATLSGEQTWCMTVRDGRGFSRSSPPLVACTGINWAYGDGQELTVLSGTDLTTWKLSQPHQSQPTFRNLFSNTILATIAAVTGVIIHPPSTNFPVAEEDVKQSTWWECLHRMAEIAICNILIDSTGAVRFVPLQWASAPCNYKARLVQYNHSPDKRITGFVVSKKTSHYTANQVPDKPYTFDAPGWKVQQLRIPVLNPTCQDESTMGSIGSVGFWTDDPSKPGAQLIKFASLGDNSYGANLTVPVSGIGLAKYFTCAVYPGSPPLDTQTVTAKLRISGSTPPTVEGQHMPGLDLAFTVTVGRITGSGARPGPVRNEALYPSAAYVLANANGLLYEANKEALKVDASGAIDCSISLCGKLKMKLPRVVPAARIERIEEHGSEGGFECSIQGFAMPWLLSGFNLGG